MPFVVSFVFFITFPTFFSLNKNKCGFSIEGNIASIQITQKSLENKGKKEVKEGSVTVSQYRVNFLNNLKLIFEQVMEVLFGS